MEDKVTEGIRKEFEDKIKKVLKLKNIKLVFGGLGALLVVVIFFAIMNLGSIVEGVAEKVGSAALGVEVAIGDVDISLADKRVTVENISIANPKGFDEDYAMKIGLINIQAKELSGKLVHFADVTLRDTEIFLEVTSRGNNLSALSDGIKKSSDSAKKETSESSKKEAPKVIIDKFLLAGAKLHPAITLVKTKSSAITLADIRITNIGKSSGGADAAKVISDIVSKISVAAIEMSSSSGDRKSVV